MPPRRTPAYPGCARPRALQRPNSPALLGSSIPPVPQDLAAAEDGRTPPRLSNLPRPHPGCARPRALQRPNSPALLGSSIPPVPQDLAAAEDGRTPPRFSTLPRPHPGCARPRALQRPNSAAWLAALLFLAASFTSVAQPLDLTLRQLKPSEPGTDQWQITETRTQWSPKGTAAVVCDMWDQHWCKSATARVAELAPRMNRFISALRDRGVLIIHCPSETLQFYAGTPGRALAQAAPVAQPPTPIQGWAALDPAHEPPLPIDDSDNGCDDDPPCPVSTPWRRQIATIEIKDGDAITDNVEAYNLMRQRGITNVLIMGVHQNMCVLGRPFSIRQMVRQGQHVALVRDLTDSMYNSRQRPWVDHFTGNDLVTWHIEKYWCPTLTSDQILGGQPFRFAADTRPPRTFHNYVKLPRSDVHWRQVQSYVEETPHPDYQQAPEAAREAFRDLKFGIRIHWGVYALLGVDASWPFLQMTPEKRDEYQHLYEKFNPVDFNADAWMELFRTNGIKVFAFTSKHHDGFSMFDTQTRVQRRVNWTAPGGPQIESCDLAYSIMEGPFKRDIVKELTEAARRHGIKIDLYFSHPDWYDADFRPFADHPLHDRVSKTEHPEQWDHFVQRHRQQLTELLTRYGPLDLMCLDQYFDETAWPDLRQTMKTLRALQPNLMFRCRGIGNYGDYYTPEGFVPGEKENTTMPWMVIYQLAGIWSYQPDAKQYKDGAWIVRNLVDTVSKGGNFMFGVGPDATGKFHPKALEAMAYAGAWLRANGEGIYATRPRPGDDWKEGSAIRFTRTKDNRLIYAYALDWPGTQLALASVKARPGSTIRMLGSDTPLRWSEDADRGLVIHLPTDWQDPSKRPGTQVFGFRIEGQTRERVVAPKLVRVGPPLLDPEQFTATCGTPGATLVFTLDGSDPTPASPSVNGPVSLPANQTLKVRAFKPGAVPSTVTASSGGTLRINFQPRETPVPEGFLPDFGETFAARDTGPKYGWSSDHTDQARQRGPGKIDDTFCHFRQGQRWQIDLPNGTYQVVVGVGDSAYESDNTLRVAGRELCRHLKLDRKTTELPVTVTLTNGPLVIDCADAPDRSTKITHVQIQRK